MIHTVALCYLTLVWSRTGRTSYKWPAAAADLPGTCGGRPTEHLERRPNMRESVMRFSALNSYTPFLPADAEQILQAAELRGIVEWMRD